MRPPLPMVWGCVVCEVPSVSNHYDSMISYTKQICEILAAARFSAVCGIVA